MDFLQQNKKIILASSSMVRKQILQDVGLEFEAISPDFDEEIAKKENPSLAIKDLALFLAQGKALSISAHHKNCLVIGSDQICEFENKAISKSNNSDEAFSQLKAFSGKTHFQNNGVVIAYNNKIIFKKFSRVKLKMRKISDEQISAYVNTDKPWGCAGSYKYESRGKHLFEKIDGDYYSILGLNIQSLLSFLHKKKYIKINQ